MGSDWLGRLLDRVGPRAPGASAAAALATLPMPGEEVPDVAVRLGGGGTFRLRALQGRPALLAIWSSRCPAARESLDALSWMASERGVQVVVLAVDGDPQALGLAHAGVPEGLRFVAAAGPLREWLGRGGRRLPPVPSFLLVDAEGRIVERQVGIEAAPEARLRGMAAALDRLPGAP